MKNIFKFFLLSVLIFSFFHSNLVSAGFFGDLLKGSGGGNTICTGGEACGLGAGAEALKDNLDTSIITNKPASEYVQSIVNYLLGFLSIIAVLYIIYAGFNILTAGGEDEKVTKSKTTIIYVIIGLLIIFLAGPITRFVLDIFNKS